jgi:hypothetical protein
MPFLFASASWADYGHRKALAAGRLEAIATATGLLPGHIGQLADSHMRLFAEAMAHQALPEGSDPLIPVTQASEGTGFGSGPEKPDEHSEGPDFSHGYSEIPQGPPGGPDPSVTVPVYEHPQPLAEATGAKKTAQDAPAGPVTDAAPLPAGVSPAGTGPDGTGPGGMLSAPPPSPGPSSVTASRDPVAAQVAAVAASVAASNPALPGAECRRVARKVVAGYLRQGADYTDTVISDAPPASGGGGGGGGGDGGGGGGMSGLEESMLGRQLINKIPGGGGGGAAGAGAGAGDVAEVAELAAL